MILRCERPKPVPTETTHSGPVVTVKIEIGGQPAPLPVASEGGAATDANEAAKRLIEATLRVHEIKRAAYSRALFIIEQERYQAKSRGEPIAESVLTKIERAIQVALNQAGEP